MFQLQFFWDVLFMLLIFYIRSGFTFIVLYSGFYDVSHFLFFKILFYLTFLVIFSISLSIFPEFAYPCSQVFNSWYLFQLFASAHYFLLVFFCSVSLILFFRYWYRNVLFLCCRVFWILQLSPMIIMSSACIV